MSKNYVDSTAANYQSRYERFKAWAEDDKQNLDTASFCRKTLLHYLQESFNNCQEMENVLKNDDGTNCIRILDAGCGSGRDMLEFNKMKFSIMLENNDKVKLSSSTKNAILIPIRTVGFDACQGFVSLAQKRGLEVTESNFIDYFKDKKDNLKFHGIFCLASLFHVPKEDLPSVLKLFHKYLATGGIVVSTIPKPSNDDNEEKNHRSKDGRWKITLNVKNQIKLFEESSFEVLEVIEKGVSIYYGDDWVILVARKSN